MLKETLDTLLWQEDGAYIDCTLGGGGHSIEILNRMPNCFLTSVDRDADAIAYATKRIGKRKNWKILHTTFGSVSKFVEPFTQAGILADLGISSHQVDEAHRGFTFRLGTKIDLRMNPQLGIDASEWIREQKASHLATILKTNSDLKASLKLAEELKKVVSTKDLYSDDIICFLEELFPKASKDWNSLAARILQAIRMELNEELDQIDQIVNAAKKLLIPGGKLVFLTYHSVEDRKVKKTLRELEREEKCPPNVLPQKFNGRPALFRRVFKKPILPSGSEIQNNSRARSAKMRVYERI
jgi:16S rRNA (cytosine1402-N4)-methyltransferase